jgi:hypothetical protein
VYERPGCLSGPSGHARAVDERRLRAPGFALRGARANFELRVLRSVAANTPADAKGILFLKFRILRSNRPT